MFIQKVQKVFCYGIFPLITATLLTGMAPRPKEKALIVVPARYSVLQATLDTAALRPVVLMSYQGETNTVAPLLHIWNGNEWSEITSKEYSRIGSLGLRIRQTIFVGEKAGLPEILLQTAPKTDKTHSISSLDTASLINELGRIFHFREKEWRWFTQRYNLDIRDVNESRRKESWYDRPH